MLLSVKPQHRGQPLGLCRGCRGLQSSGPAAIPCCDHRPGLGPVKRGSLCSTPRELVTEVGGEGPKGRLLLSAWPGPRAVSLSSY